MESLLVALCVIAFLGAVAIALVVFSPVVITVDSRQRQLRVRWLQFLEYLRPLPGASGEAGLYVFRRPVLRQARQPVKEPPKPKEPAKEKARAPRPRKKRKSPGQFFMQCLGNSTIRRALAQQLWKLGKRVSRSVVLARSLSNISLPDPALNGMLAGALRASPWTRPWGVRVNFTGENSLFLEVRFHPYRVFTAFLFFLPALPYRAMFRVWRAFAATRAE